MPVISIVVSLYNSEQTLERCIKSLVNQCEEDIEIILVNDGSTDNSREICDRWAQEDRRIRVIHKENTGKSDSLNTALKQCYGKYFTIVDSDDWVESDFCNCVRLAEDNDLDVLITGFISEPKGDKCFTHYKKNIAMSGIELMNTNSVIHTNSDLCFSWRMFFKLDFLKSNKIENNCKIKIGEDTEFNMKSLYKAKRAEAIDYCGYHYDNSVAGSLTRSEYRPSFESDLSEQFKTRYMFGGLSESYYDDMAKYYIDVLFWGVIDNLKNSPTGYSLSGVKNILNSNWLTESFKLYKLNREPNFKIRLFMFAAKKKMYLLFYLYLKFLE